MNYEFVEPNSPRWLSLKYLPNEEWKYYEEVKDEVEI